MTEYRSPSGRYISWADLVRDARSAGGRWITAFHDAPATIVRDISQQRHPLLRHHDGRLEAQLRNGYLNESSLGRGDVYVRWATDHEEDHPMPKTRHDLEIADVTAAELDALGAVLDLPTTRGRRRRAAAAALVLEEYAAGKPRRSITVTPVRFAVFTDDDVWLRALARASDEGVSIPSVLAEFAPKLLDRERQIRREGAGLE